MKRLVLLAALAAAVVFLAGEIPYATARSASPAGYEFGGRLRWVDDLNMYFSFIRQAADGHALFVNRLTHEPHAPVFFNPQWLAVGFATRWAALSDAAAFAAWRAAGVLLLALGFAALLAAARTPPASRPWALWLFLTGSGFGWLAGAFGLRGFRLDLDSGFTPFAQATLNPHFSVPHGLVLLVLACLLRGEQESGPRWYLAASVLALLEGLSRPYDLITLWMALPLFALAARPRETATRRTLWRLLPLAATLPALLYTYFLFGRHPVFHYWAAQGHTPPVTVLEHLASLGLVGVVAAWRLARRKAFPLAPGEVLLLAWLVTVLVIVHASKVVPSLPFSAQNGMTVMAPVVVLGLPLLERWTTAAGRRRTLLGSVVVINAMASVVLLRELTAVTTTHLGNYHIRTADLEAFAWLRGHAREKDVILADYLDGNRLGRFVSARVVLGHYSVTPNAAALDARIRELLAGTVSAEEARAQLASWNVRWVYASPREHPDAVFPRVPGCDRAWSVRSVTVYECGLAQLQP